MVHLDDERKLQETVFSLAKTNGRGLCLRLVRADFADVPRLNKKITEYLGLAGLTEENVDLLVDLQDITEDNGGSHLTYTKLCLGLPNLSNWRTFIFGGGAFPKDLSNCRIDEENLIPRLDWQIWSGQIGDKTLTRKPAFADYTIQHPIYSESSQFFPPSTSIKYTMENDWLIMNGQKQKYELYLASAAELVKDGRYYGENFSEGDKYIMEKAKYFPLS